MDPFPSILSASSHQSCWIASVSHPLWFPWEAAWFCCSLLQARPALSFSNPSPWPCWRQFASVLRCLSDFTADRLIALGKGALLVFSPSFLGSSAWCCSIEERQDHCPSFVLLSYTFLSKAGITQRVNSHPTEKNSFAFQ